MTLKRQKTCQAYVAILVTGPKCSLVIEIHHSYGNCVTMLSVSVPNERPVLPVFITFDRQFDSMKNVFVAKGFQM